MSQKKHQHSPKFKNQRAPTSSSMKIGESRAFHFSRSVTSWLGTGVTLIAAGYIVLSMTDPMGQNAASILSPILLLVGYGTLGLGIFKSFQQPPAVLNK